MVRSSNINVQYVIKLIGYALVISTNLLSVYPFLNLNFMNAMNEMQTFLKK